MSKRVYKMWALVFSEDYANTKENKGKYQWMGRLPERGDVYGIYHTELSAEVARHRNPNFKLLKIPTDIVTPNNHKDNKMNFDEKDATVFDRLSSPVDLEINCNKHSDVEDFE